MITLFEPWHLLTITPQPYQAECIRTEQHAENIAEVGAFTCLHDGKPVAIGGFVPAEKYGLVFDTGIAQAWMIISAGIPGIWPEIFRATKRELRNALKDYHRIEATTGFDAGERFLSMLGMEYEGCVRKGHQLGHDVSLWSVTR